MSDFLALAAVCDDNLLRGLAALRSDALDRLDNVHPLDHLAEDDVAPVEPRSLDGADEELRAVGARTSVGHRQDALTSVLELEVLVGEFLAVDRLRKYAATLSASRTPEQGRPHGRGESRAGGVAEATAHRERPRTSPPVPSPRVKSPPWSMNCGITRWKMLPL